MTEHERVPLRRARLPAADDVLPYLRAIDNNAQYSNFGPLCLRFETRLAEQFGTSATAVLTTCNATVGLSLALRAVAGVDARYCVMPAFTFPATPAAARMADLIPIFADIDPVSLAIRPSAVEALIEAGYDIAAVQPVSAFGRPVAHAEWEAFRDRTGVPVVVDAAWCFDSLHACSLPQVLSLHATKVLGIGEGGAVISTDADLMERLRRDSNFALDTNRHAERPSGNAKLSEYAAAVGLASLDAWPGRRANLAAIHRAYGELLGVHPGLARIFTDTSGDWVTATVAVELETANARECARRMAAQGIEARAWWGEPCHLHSAYSASPCTDLQHTLAAAERVLNLPFADDMDRGQIQEVVAALDSALSTPKAADHH